jgi:general secretion pathway protein B
MSLILEALRRSEAERRLGEAPGLHAPDAWRALPGRGDARERARWPWVALGLVLAMAVAAAAGAWWMRAEQAGTDAPMTSADGMAAPPIAAAAPAAPAAPPAAPPPLPAPAPAVARETAPPSPSSAVAAAPSPAIAPPAPAPAMPAPAAADAVSAGPAVAPAAAAADDRPPPLEAIDPARRAALPPLRLGLHLWDASPARRRVVIDGQRHLEGAWITPDVRLVAIVRGGCILEIDGRRWWLGVA